MKVPSTSKIDELAELHALARLACNQIERCAADLVLVGMPGGQGTLLATQALWGETRAVPFPPVAAIHLSEQHVANYEQLPHRANGYRLAGFALGILEAGPYLAWVHRQTTWQAELRAAVEAALGPGRAPTSVVVLGERDPEEITAPLALGLLASVYPAAHARYVSGPGGLFGSATYWPIHLIEAWLNGSQLATASALAADPEIWGSIGGDLISLALGGETTGSDSLAWKAYGTDHPAVARLSGYFPRADLLALPGWAADTFQQMIVARHRTLTRPRRRPRSGQKPPRSRPYLLTPTFKIGRELWLRRRLTAAEAAHSAGITEEEAVQSLERDLTPGLLEAEAAGCGRSSDLLPPQSGRHPGLWLAARRPRSRVDTLCRTPHRVDDPLPRGIRAEQPNPRGRAGTGAGAGRLRRAGAGRGVGADPGGRPGDGRRAAAAAQARSSQR